jgi:preprotein translocase subunit SecG
MFFKDSQGKVVPQSFNFKMADGMKNALAKCKTTHVCFGILFISFVGIAVYLIKRRQKQNEEEKNE